MISKVKPKIEFVTSIDRPGKIGVKYIDLVGTAYYSQNFLEKYIAKIALDLAFWQEALNQLLPNQPTQNKGGRPK